LCADCGKPGEEVHHEIYLTPENVNDPNIVYGEWNLVLLCRDCHYTRHTQRRKSIDDCYYFDEDGDMCKKEVRVYIVYGCPGSGKSRYVKEHMNVGDMVVDLDLIAQAIGLQPKAETPDCLVSTAINIRDYVYDLIAMRSIKCESVWIIAGLPKVDEREWLRDKVKADDLIFVDVSKEECIRRVMDDDERVDKNKQVQIIEKWFREFER
jgi:predicted kinase